MNALYLSADKAAVTYKSLSATCLFISDIALGMKGVIESMLPESADDQYGQLRLLVHGLTGIEAAAFEIMPGVPCDEDAKEGAV